MVCNGVGFGGEGGLVGGREVHKSAPTVATESPRSGTLPLLGIMFSEIELHLPFGLLIILFSPPLISQSRLVQVNQ